VAFPVTFESILSAVQTTVASYRTAGGLPQLTGPDGVGTGTIAFGAEYLDFQLAPPCIWIVPVGEGFEEEEYDGTSDGSGNSPPKRYFTTRHHFEAWCWGDEDPNFASTQNVLYSFDSALELRRVLTIAIVQLGGTPEMLRQDMRGRWEQPANIKKTGRMYVLSFSLKLGLDDNPYTFLPFATDTSSGIQISTTIVAVSPDGTSTTQMGTIVAPPP
jgi:hypothetical protein